MLLLNIQIILKDSVSHPFRVVSMGRKIITSVIYFLREILERQIIGVLVCLFAVTTVWYSIGRLLDYYIVWRKEISLRGGFCRSNHQRIPLPINRILVRKSWILSQAVLIIST